MLHLLLATTNAAKMARLRWLIDDTPFVGCTAQNLAMDVVPTVPEDGQDFVENAAQKAEAWSRAAHGALTLASDGGLDIPALGERWSALHTRRNAGSAADDAARIRHLLDLMRDLHGEARRAYWHEGLAIACEGRLLQSWGAHGDGGLIAESPPAEAALHGFWTENIRYYPAMGKLYRDFTPAEAEAADQVWPQLREWVCAYLRMLAVEIG